VPRAKQRTPELKNRVVRVALSTLADAGVAGFTTRTVARSASTSIPAVYELFGDKRGLVTEVVFEGFRRLRHDLEELATSRDPRADLAAVVAAFRAFVHDNAVLAEVMFSRPFAEFDPGAADADAGSSVRELIVGRVRRGIDAGVFEGDATDIAHAVLALAQGLAAQERAGWLGTSKASVERRWTMAFDAMFAGLSAAPTGRRSSGAAASARRP
jgi:AcrR family transcriptional regulator